MSAPEAEIFYCQRFVSPFLVRLIKCKAQDAEPTCLSAANIIVDEEAIITEVQPGPKTTIGESLALEFLHVSFQVLRKFKYQDKGYKVVFKAPSWISNMQPDAPLNGYLMENGAFSASLLKDGRIVENLKVTVEVSEAQA